MFIVLEGLDGAGKSTQISKLRQMLSEKGVESEYLHFPRFDAPIYGDLIAKFLRGELGTLEEVNPYLVSLLYAGDRADAAKMIREWLTQGKAVIMDRYVYSNVGYQCAKISDAQERDTLRDWIIDLEYNFNNIPRPDLSIFLDVPFEFTVASLAKQREGADRDYLNGKSDIHEASIPLQQRVRSVYIDVAKHDETLKIVDCADKDGAMATPEEIFERIKSLL